MLYNKNKNFSNLSSDLNDFFFGAKEVLRELPLTKTKKYLLFVYFVIWLRYVFFWYGLSTEQVFWNRILIKAYV